MSPGFKDAVSVILALIGLTLFAIVLVQDFLGTGPSWMALQ